MTSSSNRRPLIGVTGPDRGGFPAWICTAIAVRRAGGRPVRLTPGRYPPGADLPAFDALILGGGADVEPGRYGADPATFAHPPASVKRRRLPVRVALVLLAPVLYYSRKFLSLSASAVDLARDEFEDRCLNRALEADLPVLGICRGAQFINIHFGGTLYGDLSSFYGEVDNIATVYPRKAIRLRAGSHLAAAIGRRGTRVNSLHKQAVKQLGTDLVVVARDQAGVVQAIEHATRPFLVGVQWHPEYLPFVRSQQRIFAALVRESAKGDSGTFTQSSGISAATATDGHEERFQAALQKTNARYGKALKKLAE